MRSAGHCLAAEEGLTIWTQRSASLPRKTTTNNERKQSQYESSS